MTARSLIRSRSIRVFLLITLLGGALSFVAPSPNAAGGPTLTVTPATWDVLGLDSNNVNSGPNVFPVGARLCNAGSDPATGVVATWTWKTTQNAFTTPADGSTVTVGSLAPGDCRHVFFDVTLNRSPSSRQKSRDYQITVTGDGGLSASTPQRQLYVEKLVSQNRNSTKKLAGAGGCNLAYTACDAAPTHVLVGHTYTYKFYAETSTAYQQLESFVGFPSSILQVVSSRTGYSNPTGASSSSIYGDACGWSSSTRACIGPVNITGGKVGGRIVVTYLVKVTAPGSGSIAPTIYDFSGSSFHYNADHDTASLISGSLIASYGVDAAVTGNGNVTSAPAGTLSDGTASALDCGGSGTKCSIGYATGTSVTLTAHPLGGDTFSGWTGGGCSGASPTCTVSIDQSRSVTAAFTGVTSYPLDVSKVGSGSVTADSGALNCGATCTSRYADGTAVTLTAAPSAGWVFSGWSGEGCTGTSTCQVTMGQARAVTASFTEQTFPLAVTVGGNGIVTASPGTINCGNGNTFCSDSYGPGTSVTLTATPGTGQSFTGWSGADCSGTSTTCTVTMSQARSATATFTGLATYALGVATGGGGTGTVTSNVGGINCGASCSASYTNGTSVTLTAAPASGSSFVGWSGDCSGSNTTCVVSMTQARDVLAIFGVPQTLTVTKAGAGSGSVVSDVAGVNCGATCSASFAQATTVTLTPTASAGSIFTGWSGDCSGTGACVVTMNAAQNVTATFALAYTLSTAKSGTGAGTVASDVGGISCGATCSASYPAGSIVTLTATAASGSRFTGWSGAGCGGTGTCAVTMSAARSVTATFTALYTLDVSPAGSGSGSVTSSPLGIDCGATCAATYDDGTVATLTATAAGGSRFAGWSGAGCSGTGTCTVTMSAARSVTATFVARYTLTAATAGAGSVSSSPAGIACGATCAADYDSGTDVTLTATASGGSRFAGWSGAGCSGTGTCTVTMTAARAVTATFVVQYSLTVAKSGTGTGTVTSDSGALACGPTCSDAYDDGTVVTLSASATSGSRFTGWSGAGCSGTGTCVVTMSTARSVTAAFTARYALSVAKSGSGTGSVSADVGAVDCGPTCAADYDDGTTVTLAATAAAGSRFVGWSGGGCSGSGTCTVTMTAARDVTATFVARYDLDVSRSGSGSGAITADAGAIDCGATCTDTYDDGAIVTLTAAATTGSRFAGWSGAVCSGTGACVVTMSAARSVTAVFVAEYALTTATAGAGGGSISSSPAGIACGSTCSADYDSGTDVTLTASASSGSRFAGWSGAGCSGTGTCTVTMTGARSVTATFVVQHPLTVIKAGSGFGSVSASGIDCGATCAADYDAGSVVTLTASASPGSRFVAWSGAGCSGAGTCVVTMSAARTVTARFIARYTLGVAASGAGAGSISSDTGGIGCSAACTADYDDGDVVTLTANASSGSRFGGWSGAGCSGGGTCVVTMTAARNVTATFVALRTLVVTKTGSGSGAVSGIAVDCGATCTAAYDDGAVVTLTATADAGSAFAGWSGACSGTSPCAVTMDVARTVVASFERAAPTPPSAPQPPVSTPPASPQRPVPTYALTVTKQGSGSGSVLCGSACRERYDAGTVVTLRAVPDPGSRFAGWSGGACTGTHRCVVTMDAARDVTATFVRVYELTVVVRGAGSVATPGSSARACGSPCTTRHDANERVRLTARPRAGYWFTGWSGACHGRRPSCTVPMTRVRGVRAHFAPELELRVRLSGEFVYHLPYEHAIIGARVTWRGRPLAGSRVHIVVRCPAQRTTANRTTRRDGRVAVTAGAFMPNGIRTYDCPVEAVAHARGATAHQVHSRTVHFIHPLWLEVRDADGGRFVVRVWGRPGHRFNLFADGEVVAAGRIGADGFADVASPSLRHGQHLWVRGRDSLGSHVIVS